MVGETVGEMRRARDGNRRSTRCRKCGSGLVRLAPQQGLAERLLGWLTVYPNCCQLCGHRFLSFLGRQAFMPRRNFHRISVRFPVWLRSAFYLTEVPGQQAVATDLSVAGCRLESQADLKMAVGTRMQLHIHVPEDELLLIIDEAVVCSYPGKGVGLIFTKVRRKEKRRIAGIIRERFAGTSLDCGIT